MRCVIVNGAKLKADARCCYCRVAIDNRYLREIGTGRLYCDYDCYRGAIDASVLTMDHGVRPAGSLRQSS